jgi:plastocyanin
MGIAVGLLVPNDATGKPQAPGLDPFTVPVDNSARCDSHGLLAPTPTLCVNGFFETHGHYHENANASGPDGSVAVDAGDGQETTQIGIADFTYLPGDLSNVKTTGLPLVKLGSNLQFTNADGAAGIPHTITTCAYPCQGPTGAAFPLPNGSTSAGRPIDLDSAQLGFGAPTISGYKNETTWTTPVTAAQGYKPGEVVTYFCRIHPSMRGAFKVVQ